MAVGQLAQTVDELIDRIVTLQPLSIAEVTAGTFATKQWHYRNAEAPYWINRPSALTHVQRGDQWTLGITTKLIIAHTAARTVAFSESDSDTPQEHAWLYIPETLTYFEAIRTSLAPSGFAEIDYIAPQGITITCPRGMDYQFNPQANYEALYIDFEFIVPFMLVAL